MESSDDGLESEANVRPRPRLTGAGQPRGCPGARWAAIDRGLSRDPLAQARLNRSAKGAGTGHSPRYPKCGTTQSDRLLDSEFHRDHDRRQPIEDRSWTSGIGCEASVSANTRPYSARMTSTPRF